MPYYFFIANEDRHQNNFGLIRNAGTLEWIGPAPIFDSGSFLGCDKLPAQILSGRGIECTPFKKTHEEQLKLVTSFDWVDFDRLWDVEDDIRAVLDQAGEYLDAARKDAILSAYASRLEQLCAKIRSESEPESTIPFFMLGDIIEAGRAEGYAAAEKCLNCIRQQLQGYDVCLEIIPGNHDLASKTAI